jgi:predicted phosphodiesterase
MAYVALLCADLHVKRRVDEQYALKQIVSAAIKNKVKFVIAAGDRFDRQTNRSDAVNSFYTQLTRLYDKDIEFWYLQGQHDFDDPPWLAGHPAAKHLHKQTLTVGPYTAYGLDFQSVGKLQEELAEIPKECDLLVAHQTWGEWMGSIASPQGQLAQIPGHVLCVFSGDLHKYRYERNKNSDGDAMLCISPGATAMQKIDEPTTHYYLLMDDSGAFHRRELLSRRVIDWPVMTVKEDMDRFMEEIEGVLATEIQVAVGREYPEEMVKPYLRVTYSHRLPDVLRRVEKIVAGRAIHYWKELPPEEKQSSKNKPLKVTGDLAVTPLSLLPSRVNKEEKPEVFELTARLLVAENPQEEFQRWWAEFLQE